MAGKHEGADSAPGSTLGPNYFPGSRIDRAYAEGRRVGKDLGALTDNPHDGLGTDEEEAWDLGYTNNTQPLAKYETAE